MGDLSRESRPTTDQKTLHIDTWVTTDCTVGRLRVGLFRCFTLELPWLDNEEDISCIPDGVYEAEKFDSPKHGPVILIKNVPQRTMIELHAGNFTRDILGCLVVGEAITYLDRDAIMDVTNSVVTLRRLLARLPDKFMVSITRVFSPEVGSA